MQEKVLVTDVSFWTAHLSTFLSFDGYVNAAGVKYLSKDVR